MNRGLSVEQLDGLLDERRLATLATFRQDGSVLLSPLWFIWEDGGFTIGMAAADGKLKHLRRDPRVTILVAEDEFPYRGFEVRGVARLLDVQYGPVIRRIATRYVGVEAAAFYDDERGGTIARIEPGDSRGWDFRDDLTAMGVFEGVIAATFADAVTAFLADTFRLDPVFATSIGEHEHDARWPDLTSAGRAERLAMTDRWLATFRAMTDLPPDDAIDRDLLIGQLEAEQFAETILREHTWNPLDWVYLIGEGLFSLQAREFAPLAARLTSTAGRLETLPGVLDAARESLVGDAGRPVGRFQTETALRQIAGIEELIADALASADAAAPTDPDVAAVVPRLTAAAATARDAVATFVTHLRDVVLPASEGEGRIGAELFAAKLRHTMRSDTLTPERILTGAEREYTAVRAEMIRLARDLWPLWRSDEPLPDDEQALVRGVLDAVAAEHPEADDLLDYCRAENARIEAFCREHDLIGLADEPLVIQWTPVFLRSFGGAMLSSPGPLDKGQKAFFAITPMPDDWTADQRESNLREDNDRMLRVLTIHEAVPGHYLQGVYANRCPSMVRAIFGSGLFAEGWAVYVTQVMMDRGYGADDPALMLTHWKFYLRAVTNAIIDRRIHCDGMTEEEAVELMVEGGFQEHAEARAKFDRARLSSTQLSTYFAGSLEMWEIEREARHRAAVASGDPRGTAAVPEPRVVGDFGETPGFVYRAHLEAVISHGTPPTSLLRRILFG